ncbi:MAG: class I SAM-dependent methyltransferase [Ignavibacteriaceae bacterium]|nr:class I SAM-dependent methyltransferase [Ignavibacteriaceae bacterium]
MEEEFRKDLYQNYYSYHTKQLYGTITLSSIINQFEAWEFYYSEFLPIEKNIKILDAGCGYGGFVYWLTELGYSKVSGIDRSNEMIDLGKSLNINNISQVDIFEHLTITTNTYDLIFCRDVLEHLDKNEVYKIFKLF